MDIVKHNRDAWKSLVESGDKWTLPASHETIAAARNNNWNIVLTPNVFVPKKWFGNIKNKKVLCLASGGGQQAPILAAAGAVVTSFDNCREQLDKDNLVAEREGLLIETLQGDMRDLSCFDNESFDLIFHPVSNCFVDDIQNVWNECYRVLRDDGILLAGVGNPVLYIFDLNLMENDNKLEVKYKIPYSDIEQLPRNEFDEKIKSKSTLNFGHSLDSQIGGQIKAGFLINGFYEDSSNCDTIDQYIKTYIATSALKKDF